MDRQPSTTLAEPREKPLSATPGRPTGIMTLAIIELVAAVLLLVAGVVLVAMSFGGFTGGGGIVVFAALEFLLALVSFAAASRLRSVRHSSWSLARWLAIATIVVNTALMAIGTAITFTLSFPGAPVFLFVVANDVNIAEVAVLYLLTRPDTKAEFQGLRA